MAEADGAPGSEPRRDPSWARRALDGLYAGAGWAAAAFLAAMLAVIVAQMAARWIGISFRGAPNYAGYCMAAASFLALASTMNAGAHIRVRLGLNALGPPERPARRWAEVACLAVAFGLSAYFAWYAVRATWVSHKINDVSQGQDATPLWIPQIAMCLGAILLAICLLDNLVRRVVVGRDNIRSGGVSAG